MTLFKRLCAALLLLCAAGTVHAQAAGFALPTCIHKSVWTPFGTGSDWVHDTSAPVKATGVRVSWWGWWCPTADGNWTAYVHMCVEGRTCLTATQVTIELDTAMRTLASIEPFVFNLLCIPAMATMVAALRPNRTRNSGKSSTSGAAAVAAIQSV